MLTATARRAPNREAVVCGGRRLSFAELDARTTRLANALMMMGLAVGDRVALHMANSIAVVEVMAAIAKAGGIVVPISTRLAAPEIRYMLEDTRPFAAIYSPDVRDAVQENAAALDDIRFIVDGVAKGGEQSLEALIEGASDQAPALGSFSPDDAMLSYTSGTTGRPKGAIATHRNLVIGLGWINATEWRLSAEDRTLVATPMSHRTGMARIASSFCLGSTLIVQERFDPAETVRLIEAERVSHIGVVPTIARMLLPAIQARPDSCASLRTMLATGEVFPTSIKDPLFAALPRLELHSFYSQTEAGVVTNLRPEEQQNYGDSIGQPIAGVELRLVDGDLEDVTPGETGEILVRCGEPGEFTLMREYFNRPEDTKNTIVDGWVRTGDMAREGDNGYLYFVDRLKDMIVSGGLNIYSVEVEDALLNHPAIHEAAVIGVPDAEFGEAVMAFVVAKDGATPGEDALIEHCRQHIASYKKPRHIRFVDSLPRNTTGKVAKPLLRGQAASGD
ncbi:MAG: AMP-binding protein [Proteobacteria bacterium]|nr:AMP-binding protein [Pseudomonadota bacterium]MDA1324117.1 AMP-binding protein [Pseudomonadota bacterium]